MKYIRKYFLYVNKKILYYYCRSTFFTDLQSQVSGSVYDPFDPFDYMYSTNESANSDPVYAAVEKSAKSPAMSPAAPPPLPPRNSSAWNTIERRKTSLDRRVNIGKILFKHFNKINNYNYILILFLAKTSNTIV